MIDDACRTTDGQGDPRAEAEGELAVARLVLDGGEEAHAASHVASALHYDPTFADCYAMVDALAERAGDLAVVNEWFGGGEQLYIGSAAALAALRARAGQHAGAVELLAMVTAAEPIKPWAAAPWFSAELGSSVSGEDLARSISRINTAIGDPAPVLAVPLAPWLSLARVAAARPEIVSSALAMLSGLARRIGAIDDAIAWCTRAEALENESAADGAYPLGAVMLGYALRTAGRPDETIAAWMRALERIPKDIDLHIDLAETCMQLGDNSQAVVWAARAAEIDPSHVKPKAVGLAARFALSDHTDNDVLNSLGELAQANPEHGYPAFLYQQAKAARPWIGGIPLPTEAAGNLLAQLASQTPRTGIPGETVGQVTVSGIESPSAVTALLTYFPKMSISVMDNPSPDIREPMSTAFGTPIWTYQGTDAVPAVAAASSAACDTLRALAGGGGWADPFTAYERASALAGLSASDLLGLVAFPLLPPEDGSWEQRWRMHPAFWARMAQAWACVGILHHRPEQPWQGSERRKLLLRLLFGPEDWCVDAAAFALYTSALMNPDQQEDIAAAICARYLHVTRALGLRPTELHRPFAHIVIACPRTDPQLIEFAREMLAEQSAAAADAEDDSDENDEVEEDDEPDAAARSLSDEQVAEWAERLLGRLAD